jgi:hypothetical protein
MDPIESIKPQKDSTLAMLLEALFRIENSLGKQPKYRFASPICERNRAHLLFYRDRDWGRVVFPERPVGVQQRLAIYVPLRLGRECPHLSCEVVFEPSEWKPVDVALKRTDPPATPPRLNEMIRMIVSL